MKKAETLWERGEMIESQRKSYPCAVRKPESGGQHWRGAKWCGDQREAPQPCRTAEQCETEERDKTSTALLLRSLATAHLLSLQVFVEEVERLLVARGTAGNGEHPLPGVIVRSLGDRDAGAGTLSDLADLAPASADDTAHHVGGNTNVLRLNLFAVLSRGGWGRATGGVGAGPAAETGGSVVEVSAVAGAGVAAGPGRAHPVATIGEGGRA